MQIYERQTDCLCCPSVQAFWTSALPAGSPDKFPISTWKRTLGSCAGGALVVVVVNYPGSQGTELSPPQYGWGSRAREGSSHTMPGIRWKSKLFPLPDPSLPAEADEKGRLGESQGAQNFPPPTLLSDFPGFLRVLIHCRVRKPIDGTVLFLEEPSLSGGQGWDARMLEKPCTSEKCRSTKSHRGEGSMALHLPIAQSTVQGRDICAQLWDCQNLCY